MTTSGSAARAGMRQQLDELDALLQRMLALPINPLEGAAAAREAPPSQAPSPVLQDGWRQAPMKLLDSSSPVPPPAAPDPTQWDPTPGINLNPQNGSSIFAARSAASAAFRAPPVEPPPPVWRSETVGYTLPDGQPAPLPVEPAGTLLLPEPPFRPRFVARPAPLPLLAWPLGALDRLFESLVSAIPVASCLATRTGKNLLGFAGVVMTVGGLAWGALDYFGWPR